MKKCPKCLVNVNTNRVTCPLCRTTLNDTSEVFPTIYQPYPKFKQRVKRRHIALKILLFLSISAVIISGVINYLTLEEENPIYWSLIVLIGTIVIWCFGRGIIVSKGNFGRRLSLLNISIILLLMAIEFDLSSKSWTLNYLVPFLLIAEDLTLAIMSMISVRKYREVMPYLFGTIIISIVPVLLCHWQIIEVSWPSISCLLCAISVVLGIIIFGFKTTINQIKKYFHI